MEKACLAVMTLTMACGGLSAGTIVRDVNYDGYIQHVGAYNALVTTGSGVLVGAWYRADPPTIFEQRSVSKWDISGLKPVDSAVITFHVSWSSLTDVLAGDITISTFPTDSNGAVVETDGGWNGDIPIAPTASKVAFASAQADWTDVTVDVTDWLNAAIDAGLPYFSVRLSVDYLFQEPALSAITPGNSPVCFICSDSYWPSTLTFIPEKVQAPVFSQTYPYVSGPTPITINCGTEEANIYYTLDGSTPTSASTLYTGEVMVNPSKTLKAIAVTEGYSDSLVTSASYFLLQERQVDKTVDHDGWILHNGGYNAVNDTGYGIQVGAWYRATPETIFEERGVFKWDMSNIVGPINSAVITFYINWSSLTDALVGNIKISTFTTANNGAIVDTDGGWDGATPIAPTASKMAFISATTSAIAVDVTDWLNAAIDDGLTYFSIRLDADYLFVEPTLSSLVPGANPISYIWSSDAYPATLTYVSVVPAQVEAPVFSQTDPYVSGPTPITMTCATEGANIYYTIDGSMPTASSTPYTGAVEVNNAITLKAIAVASGYSDSPVTSVSYVLACGIPAINSINVDGNLSDWSASSPWSQAYVHWIGSMSSTTRAKFAWNDENDMLYVAIETNEFSDLLGGHPVVGFGTSLDQAAIYADGATQLAFDTIAGGNSVNIVNEIHEYKILYPSGTKTYVDSGIVGVQAGYSYNGSVWTYEIAIPLWTNWAIGQMTTKTNLSAGDAIYLYSMMHNKLNGVNGTDLTYNGNPGFPSPGGFAKAAKLTLLAPIPGDANNDGMVDVGDLGILAANYGGSDKSWGQGDFNGDHLVDVGDLGILAAHYGEGSINASSFSDDYAIAFGTTVEEDTQEVTNSSICSTLGLPLIAGLALMGLMLVKLEE
jgi:hypothetical protein